MNTPDNLQALRRANPRTKAEFPHGVEAAAETVHARIAAEGPLQAGATSSASTRAVPRRRFAAGALVVAAAAAVKRAATVTAASGDRSGTAVVRITHDGELWAGTTIRWHDDDIAISGDGPQRGDWRKGELRVVDGILYGTDPVNGGWIEQGSPANIDPDSGTTPGEHLAAVREDVEGATLARLGENMTGLTTTLLDDGSKVYAGTVPAGQIAREEGFKEGEHIRVFPFGYVAHGRAADPAAQLDTAVTVGADGIIRELAVTWGAWSYTVSYGDLGTAAAVVAPKNAKSLLRMRGLEDQQQ
jgi:hypothetical protein